MRFIHEFFLTNNLDYDLKRIKEIYDFIDMNITKRNGNTLSLATALWLYVDDKHIEIIPKKLNEKKDLKEVLVESEGEYIFGNNKLVIKPFYSEDIFIFPESTANFAYVDLTKIHLPITLRTRKDGDIITPYGMKGSMKLKKYFNSKGVNRHKRDEIPLLVIDNEVLWAAGVGLSNKIAVEKIPTHVIEVI
jgi:tRNA(Ile)-lysidine synthase